MRCLRIIMALSLIFVSVGLHSEDLRGHRFHYGAEWGINSPMLVGIYNTYLSTEGYLVETKDLRFSGHVNGAVLGFVGYDMSPRFGMSLLGGYMGLRAGERAYPVSLRGSFALGMNGLEEGGSIFVEAGAAFRHSVKPAPVGKSDTRTDAGLPEILRSISMLLRLRHFLIPKSLTSIPENMRRPGMSG